MPTAVVVEDALYPLSSVLTVRHVCQNCSVFSGYTALVVKPIGDPAANLFGTAFARVQANIKWVMDVICLTPLAQLGLKLDGSPRRLILIR